LGLPAGGAVGAPPRVLHLSGEPIQSFLSVIILIKVSRGPPWCQFYVLKVGEMGGWFIENFHFWWPLAIGWLQRKHAIYNYSDHAQRHYCAFQSAISGFHF
jgi:hypothetical protein